MGCVFENVFLERVSLIVFLFFSFLFFFFEDFKVMGLKRRIYFVIEMLMDGRWIFDNLCTLLLSLRRWFFKGKQRFDEFDYNRIMERYIYIFERLVEPLTLLYLLLISGLTWPKMQGDDVIGYRRFGTITFPIYMFVARQMYKEGG